MDLTTRAERMLAQTVESFQILTWTSMGAYHQHPEHQRCSCKRRAKSTDQNTYERLTLEQVDINPCILQEYPFSGCEASVEALSNNIGIYTYGYKDQHPLISRSHQSHRIYQGQTDKISHSTEKPDAPLGVSKPNLYFLSPPMR